MLLLIVPGLILMTIWVAVIPAIVLEHRGIGDPSVAASSSSGKLLARLRRRHPHDLALDRREHRLGALLLPVADWLASVIQQFVSTTVVTPFVVVILTLVYYRRRAATSRRTANPAEPDAAV